MKKEIRIVIFSSGSCAHALPNNSAEFIKWWEEKFNLCPSEYSEKLQVDCSTSTYYDSSQLEVEIYYYRPETDEEYENRLKKEQQALEFRKNQELCELERLKKKYEI